MNKMFETIRYLLLFLIVPFTLIEWRLFGSGNLFCSFSYILISCLLVLFVFIPINTKTTNKILRLNILSIAFLVGLVIYLCSYSLYTFGLTTFNHLHYYWIATGLLIYTLFYLFCNEPSVFSFLRKLIVTVACCEGLICIAQKIDLMPTTNSLFHVSGSCSNPNVTAMFLALSAPLLFIGLDNRWKKLLHIFLLSLIVVSVILLKSRTGLVGVIVCCAVFTTVKYSLYNKIIGLRPSYRIAICVASISLLAVCGWTLLNFEKESSYGRMFIWKISALSIAKKPIFGAGLSMFQHDYNLEQAAYIKSNNLSQHEIQNAAFVNMPYNDYLSILFEGGVVGLLLYLGFILALLVRTKYFVTSNEGLSCMCGILAFLTMGVVNFSLTAVPALLVFSIYVAYILATQAKTRSKRGLFSFVPRIGYPKLLYSVLPATIALTQLEQITPKVGIYRGGQFF